MNWLFWTRNIDPKKAAEERGEAWQSGRQVQKPSVITAVGTLLDRLLPSGELIAHKKLNWQMR